MRVVLGYGASPDSDVAAALVARVHWPHESQIRIVHAVETRAASGPDDPLAPAAGRAPTRLAQEDADLAAQSVARWLEQIPAAEFTLGYGKAVTVLADEARLLNADLLVVGSRRRGPYATLLFGSVSADLVDMAPCPVLIARGSTVSRVVLAADGSDAAQRAIEIVAAWPLFDGAVVEVLSVGDAAADAAADVGTDAAVGRGDTEGVADPRGGSADPLTIAQAAAQRLRAAGRQANATARIGKPAEHILELAATSRADLVVMGTRGHTGLNRAILGSTAREVLLATEASVLVCRIDS
jgi:nucleotide-binding universal stress UspA family protein